MRAAAGNSALLDRVRKLKLVSRLVLEQDRQAEGRAGVARNLDAAFGLPVLLQDERLTSFVVRDAIEEGRLPRPRRKGEPLDHYAAAVILEDALRALAVG